MYITARDISTAHTAPRQTQWTIMSCTTTLHDKHISSAQDRFANTLNFINSLVETFCRFREYSIKLWYCRAGDSMASIIRLSRRWLKYFARRYDSSKPLNSNKGDKSSCVGTPSISSEEKIFFDASQDSSTDCNSSKMALAAFLAANGIQCLRIPVDKELASMTSAKIYNIQIYK